MRLYEIENKRELNVNFNKIWDKIIKNQCSDIINIYQETNKFLYRGSKGHKDIYRGSSAEGRSPVSSSKTLSDIFDNYLKTIGITALRSNSIFTVSNYLHAKNFGTPYIIFPVNGFEYSYTKHYDIVIDDWSELISQTSPIRKYIDIDNFDSVDDILADIKEKYPNDSTIQNLTAADILMTVPEFIKFNKPSNQNLKYAIDKELEVLIKGRYYAFKYLTYYKLINQKLGAI